MALQCRERAPSTTSKPALGRHPQHFRLATISGISMTRAGRLSCAISGHRPVSLDHLVGAAEQRHWNRKCECFGSLEIDNQLDLRGLLYRETGRLLALENASGKNTGQPVRIRNAAAVTHQSTGVGKRAILEDCGHRVAERQCS